MHFHQHYPNLQWFAQIESFRVIHLRSLNQFKMKIGSLNLLLLAYGYHSSISIVLLIPVQVFRAALAGELAGKRVVWFPEPLKMRRTAPNGTTGMVASVGGGRTKKSANICPTLLLMGRAFPTPLAAHTILSREGSARCEYTKKWLNFGRLLNETTESVRLWKWIWGILKKSFLKHETTQTCIFVCKSSSLLERSMNHAGYLGFRCCKFRAPSSDLCLFTFHKNFKNCLYNKCWSVRCRKNFPP